MSTWELLNEKKDEAGPWLRRAFWLPLRRVLQIFHILPLVVALVVFVLVATDGQLREICVSYLEDAGTGDFAPTAIRFAAAAAGFALISAVLYQTHYLLSTARMNVVYSVGSETAGSGLRGLQEAAAIVQALSPWLGLAVGLLRAKIYLADLFHRLGSAHADRIASMQLVPMPSPWAIVVAVMVLGLVMSSLVVANPKSRTLPRVVILATPPAAALLFLLLTDPPDFTADALQIVTISASVAVAVALYYFAYDRLQTMRARFVYSSAVQRNTGLNLRKFQRLLLFIWALLPWVMIVALYFAVAPPPASTTSLHGWAMIPVAMSWVISAGLVVVVLLHRFRESTRWRWWTYGMVVSLAIAGLIVSWILPDDIITVYRLIGPLGSLALALLFQIAIFALLAVLSQRSGFPVLTLVILVLVCSTVLPISIGVTVAALAVLCAVAGIMAAAANLWAAAAVALVLAVTGGINFAKTLGQRPVELNAQAIGNDLTHEFNAWLDHKGNPAAQARGAVPGSPVGLVACLGPGAAKSQPYPVFIVAVEGGGIYAASAASLFFARLQDRNPCFAGHVFAISAVSGGAIGATVFQALEKSSATRGLWAAPADTNGKGANSSGLRSNCLPRPSASARSNAKDPPTEAKNPLTDEVSAIMQDDHFSPLVAEIFPELVGFTRSGRAQELAASFAYSVNTQDRGAAQTLCDPFAADWSASRNDPALVLNATWVETGFRAAFAPFPLHAIDDSLYSFVDQNMPDAPDFKLIEAAVVSARFPGVLPPYSVLINKSARKTTEQTNGVSRPGTMRWNFVDGGYADSSGAATALALYKALKDTAAARGVALHVILVTSSNPRFDPNDIEGTAFADVLGPVDAILSVRAGLANEAVARACDGVTADGGNGTARSNTCENRAGRRGAPLQIVGIEDQTYGLSLGWKISRTTFSVVSWMLGSAESTGDFCNEPILSGDNSNSQPNGQFQLNEEVVRRNTCVLHSILKLLDNNPLVLQQ